MQKAFPAFRLDASFALDSQRLAILGASGSGKTVTLKSVAGLIKPDSGLIRLGDRALYDSSKRICVPPQRRRVGYLFQNYALFPHMSVRENVACAFGRASRAQKLARAGELLERFGLGGLSKSLPGQLSGGQQQRAALARIFASAPEALLLDEPFSALDAHLRRKMQEEALELTSGFEGFFALVTHDMEEAYRMSDCLLVLDKGAVAAFGPTAGVFSNPGNIRAARLTGCDNFSRAVRRGESLLYAADWGAELATTLPIPPNVAYVGACSRDMRLSLREGEENCIAVSSLQARDGPFYREAAARPALGSAGALLRFRLPKALAAPSPACLCIPAGKVLPLEE
jgi:molybdate transport system ATP-binding protein